MNKKDMLVALALLLLPILAHASCDTVKADIDAKIQANGASHYTLEVVPADQPPAEGKVVGQCEGNQQIVYSRGAGAAESAASLPTRHVRGNTMDSDAPAPASAASSGG